SAGLLGGIDPSFEEWVQRRLSMTPQYARRYLSVYEHIPEEKFTQLGKLSRAAPFEPASPSSVGREEVLAEVERRVKAGELRAGRAGRSRHALRARARRGLSEANATRCRIWAHRTRPP